jgi:hypothetical protein
MKARASTLSGAVVVGSSPAKVASCPVLRAGGITKSYQRGVGPPPCSS